MLIFKENASSPFIFAPDSHFFDPTVIRKLALVLSFIFVFVADLHAQTVTATGSNLLRIGSGRSAADNDVETRKRYFEEIANARIFFDNLSIGLRYEMDDPSEIGRSFQGLRRRWIQYKKDRVELQAGDVTALFGRGLAVNLFESRPLNYDTWLDGLYGHYEYLWPKEEIDLRPSIGVQGVAGRLDFFDILHDIDDPNPDLKLSARAINAEFGLFGKKLLVGTSFLQAFTDAERMVILSKRLTQREVNQPEIYVNFVTGEFEAFLQFTEARSYIGKLDNKDTAMTHKGQAMYGSLSYANENFGLTVEYKDYRYNMRSSALQPTYFNKLPISSPPEAYREHVYTSISRLTHAVNFNDEFGWQTELNITAIPQVDITLNAAASSSHRAFGEIRDSNGTRSVQLETMRIVPEFTDIRYKPFWDIFAEAEYALGDLDYVRLGFHRTSNTDNLYTKLATTLLAKLQFATTNTQSFQAILEHQWMYDEGSPPEFRKYLNEMITVQYSMPALNFGGLFDYSTNYSKKKHIWPQAFVSLRIGDAHNLLVSYGSERGGINCTGGICRVVPAFDGLRATMTSQF